MSEPNLEQSKTSLVDNETSGFYSRTLSKKVGTLNVTDVFIWKFVGLDKYKDKDYKNRIGTKANTKHIKVKVICDCENTFYADVEMLNKGRVHCHKCYKHEVKTIRLI